MDKVISLSHGSGGKLYHQMVKDIFLPAFDNHLLDQMNDASVCRISGDRIAMTTDSFVINPRFFPGGDIGHLAVCGTVNDLAVSGAKPLYLTCGMVIEAGFPEAELRKICASMAKTAKEAEVMIVTGDTKVVEKGNCDGIYINTAGVGVFDREPLEQKVRPGDAILVSGFIGDHGMSVMAARYDLTFDPPLESDAQPLNGLIGHLLQCIPEVHCLRDATRGGVAAVCHEWAESAGCGITLEENALPVRNGVRSACELLGIEPLYVANEGKFVAAVPREYAEQAVEILRQHKQGKDASIIGYVEEGTIGVYLLTEVGSKRILDMPDGEQLPRIC